MFVWLHASKAAEAKLDVCGIELASTQMTSSNALRMCAERGDVRALAWLGLVYLSAPERAGAASLHSERDRAEGLLLVEIAARRGDAIAQNELGLMHMQGSHVAVDYDRAFDLFSAADQQNDMQAAYNLARMHFAGIGRDQSTDRAVAYLSRSVSRGNIAALCTLAQIYEQDGRPLSANAMRSAARVWLSAYRVDCGATGMIAAEFA
jgi:TPR repeat protein